MSASDKDYYQILGVEPTADEETIKRAYRRLARELHPDVDSGDEEAFKDLAEAYGVLGDPQKRSQYDATRVGSDWSGILHHVFRPRQRPRRNTSIRVPIAIGLPELLTGFSRDVTFPRVIGCDTCGGVGGRRERCENCGGTGQALHSEQFMKVSFPCSACGGVGSRVVEACGTCHGRGVNSEQVTKHLEVPPGFNNAPLHHPGEGNAEIVGLPAGDLFFVPAIRDDFRRPFTVAGHDLTMPTVPVDPVLFVVGGVVHVESPLDEGFDLELQPGTGFGTTTVVHGRGLPTTMGASEPRGNLFIRLIPQFPDDLTEGQMDLLRRYAETRAAGANPASEEDQKQEVMPHDDQEG